MSTLRIYFFAQPRVYRDDRPLPEFPTAKTQLLFCYLVLQRKRCHSRAVLASLFWGDSVEEQARKSLRTTLWRLRHLLEGVGGAGAYLTVKNDEIGFNINGDYWLDVEEFEQHLTWCARQEHLATSDPRDPALVKSLQDTIDLYQGDLLEGCYEDWCLYERERLQGMYLDAMARLMVCYRAQGYYDRAISCGQQILRCDPLMEEVHREMMRLHALAGNRGAALRQYRLCREILARELQIEPMEETNALYAQICAQSLPPAHHPVLSSAPQAALAHQAGQAPPPLSSFWSVSSVNDALSELRQVQSELQYLSMRFQKGIDVLETFNRQLLEISHP